MSDPHETTEEHLARLLGRALNSFELPDATIERLDCALAHNSALHSSHHSSGAGLHRETYRHTFLIADGSDLTLWELVYDTGAGAGPQHELYTGQEEARLAVTRIRGADAAAMFPDEDPEDDLGILSALKSTPPAPVARTYSADRSADHARRVLRRAENPDRPGEDVARLLRSAFAHQISQAFGTQCRFETGEDMASPSTSTPSCCSTARSSASGRSSTRPRPTAATCARCTPRRAPPGPRWSCAPA